MRGCLFSFALILIVATQGIAFQAGPPQAATAAPAVRLVGRWQVKFILQGSGEKNLVFEAKAAGAGSFQLLDTGPDNKPEAHAQPAAWSELSNDRVSFSSEVELPIGTCCRELGTLIFKGKFTSENSISGKLLFVTSVDEEENPFQYRSLLGTFTATRVVK